MKNLLTILCFIAFSSYGQSIATVDSLLNSVNLDDSSHIHKTVKALRLSKMLEYQKGEARAYHFLGYHYAIKGSYPLAMEKYLRAALLYKGIGNTETEAQVHVNVAYVYHSLKNYDKEIRACKEAIRLSKKDSLKSYAYNCLGRAEMALGNTEQSIKYFNKALELKEKVGQFEDLHKFLTNLGNSYIKIKAYDNAINVFGSIARHAYKRKDVLARMYNNLGVCYHFKKDYDNAQLNYLESIALDIKSESGGACLNYAELLYQMGKPQKAKHYLAAGLNMDYDLGHLGRTLFAMEMYKESSLVRDSLYMHATKDFELLMNESVSIATIESDLRNAREKALLRGKFEAERDLNFWIIVTATLIFGLIFRYIVKYYRVAKNSSEIKMLAQRIAKKYS